MEVYREERPLERPPAAAARELFGDAERRDRRDARAGGLVRTGLRIDDDAGRVVATVRMPLLGVLTALAVLAAAIGVVRPGVRLPALWLCTFVVLAPLAALLPDVAPRPSLGTVTDRRVTPVTAPAYAGAIALLWLSLRPVVGPAATALCGSVLAAGLGSYAVAAGWRTASVSSLWLAVAGLLPAVVTVANLSVAAALVDVPGGRPVAVGGAVGFGVASSAVVVGYCTVVHGAVRRARFAPLGPAPVRVGALAGYLLVVLALSVAVAALLPTVAAAFPTAVVALLCLPLALPVGGWVVHATGTTVVRYRALRGAGRRRVDGTRVYVVDADATLVRAVPFPRGVLVSRRVVDALAADELAAVIAHEAHHLRRRDRLALAAATLASLPVGRNALEAFLDHPARERAADAHAAATVGPGPLVRALRRLETAGAGDDEAPHPLLAPYALLYGAGPAAAYYPSVDDRVAAVTR